ncbi:hypothetical protein B9G69_001470 [Bdellovibrio sp. SKB1291214]|uniref:hypothetical protein n=1 Tax=Bdellovibrio sp. SKB1291214 TaxID=1732569 RepID=UPI00223FE615|nr:hypothetical protein [Bdellovibrio sp. SKB1291214]UYL09244.1 hypothetical protein B9G69_001470 [Bdellovibrio sp. SKB1291214]
MHFKTILALLIVSVTLHSKAEEVKQAAPEKEQSTSEKAKEVFNKATVIAKQATDTVVKTFNETRVRREAESYFVLGSYSGVDLLIPGKYGATVGAIQSADNTWEIEYLRGSVAVPVVVADLGSMRDERISLIRRSYFGGNSFNLSYGLSYYNFTLHLGDDILSRVTSGYYPNMGMIQIEALGLNVALGNRWIFRKNITLGVDWFSWSQPLHVTHVSAEYLNHATNQQDIDNVQKGIDIISHFPRFAAIKFQLGILF